MKTKVIERNPVVLHEAIFALWGALGSKSWRIKRT